MRNYLRAFLMLLLLLGISALKERIKMMRKQLAAMFVAFLILGAVPMKTWAHGGAQDPGVPASVPGYDPDSSGSEG